MYKDERKYRKYHTEAIFTPNLCSSRESDPLTQQRDKTHSARKILSSVQCFILRQNVLIELVLGTI
jgi:hypothetical protein